MTMLQDGLPKRNYEFVFLLVITLLASILLFSNLGNHYFWQDEAETALIAKTILSDGLPRGTDGLNYFSQVGESAYGEDYLWTLDPWLPHYLTALSFKIFGVNTFAGRFPFALFSLFTVLLTFFYCKYSFSNKKIAYWAVLFLTTSIPFLLLSRQCRYYSLVMFFIIASFFVYQMILDKKRWAKTLFFLCSTLLFHSYYAFTVITLSTVLVHSFLVRRERFKSVFLVCLFIALLNSIWILAFSGLEILNIYPVHQLPTPLQKFSYLAIFFLSHIFRFMISPYLLIAFLIIRIAKKKSLLDFKENAASFLALFGVIYFIEMCFLAPLPYFRYFLGIVPVAAIFMAFLFQPILEFRKPIIFLIFLVLLFQSLFVEFCYEITHDYDGPIEGITKFLNQNADPNDFVLIGYGDLPLKFYTDLRIIGGPGNEGLSEVHRAKWVIPRSEATSKKIRTFISRNLEKSDFKPHVIPYPDAPYENRENPAIHHFQTPFHFPPVTIFERRT